ncbi:MAG: VWA domain-containing protein [Bdellovibrionales bacterium]
MSFHSPGYFIFFIVILFLIYWLFRNRKQRAKLQVGSLSTFKKVVPSLKAQLAQLPTALKILSFLFIVMALARPQQANTKTKKNVEGIDIMVALDVSDSMLIEDMGAINRMETAKDTLKKFVEKRNSDRIGVVIFAGESFTLVPPTLDYPLLLDQVSRITTAANAKIKDGTAIGVALANAAGRLRDSKAKSKVVIFLTDGENNSGTIDPETGLEIAKGYGLKIYSIGIGKDGPTRIPVTVQDMFGNKVKTYQPFESRVNDELLQKFASDTGGRYFRATREDGLEGVFDEINRLETTQIDVNKFTRYTEKFTPYAWLAFWLYLMAWILEFTWLRRLP